MTAAFQVTCFDLRRESSDVEEYVDSMTRARPMFWHKGDALRHAWHEAHDWWLEEKYVMEAYPENAEFPEVRWEWDHLTVDSCYAIIPDADGNDRFMMRVEPIEVY